MAIGVFDSGIGGLTVYQSVARSFPDLDLFYLGDTARVPYGNKSRDTIIRYSIECGTWLKNTHTIDALIIACNTASSVAVPVLRERLGVPVIGVVEPGAKQALAVTETGRIGVIGTQATVKSGAYRSALERLAGRSIEVHQQHCPLFVPLVEEGMLDGPITESIIRHYLDDLVKTGVDAVILGCTHYPLLKPAIQKLYPNVAVVDSSIAILDEVRALGLAERSGKRSISVTDESAAFEKLKEMLVGDVATATVTLPELTACLPRK